MDTPESLQRVAIVTDSIACLNNELVERYRIMVVPYSFYIDGKVYRDWVDISPSEAYRLFLNDPHGFHSSPASPTDWLEAYRDVGQRTRSIVCVTVSSKLSTAYNVARVAREQGREKLPGIRIKVVDSLTATAAEGFVALAAARAAEAGKSLDEVAGAAELMGERVTLAALMDTVRYIYRSGRIPEMASRLGSVLNIKPIFTVSQGSVRILGAARNKDRGIDRLLGIVRKRVGRKAVHMSVMHAYAPDEAERLMERVSAEFDCAELWLTEFSPLMGYACGTGTLGLAFYTED